MKLSILKKKWVWGIVIVLIVGGVLMARRNGDAIEAKYEFATIERADLNRFVDVVGAVQPIEYVDVSFEQPGRVAAVYVVAGQVVAQGQLLAALSNADVNADVSVAVASVDAQEARLNQLGAAIDVAEVQLQELLNGSRPEEVGIKRAAWNSSVVDFGKAITDTVLVRNDALDDVSYSIEVTLAGLFGGQQSTSFNLSYSTCDVQRETDIGWQRQLLGSSVDSYVLGDVHTDADAVAELGRVLNVIYQAEDFVRDLFVTLSDDCTRADTSLAAHRTAVDAAYTRITLARDAVLAHRQALATKRNVRDSAESALRLAQMGPRAETIAAAEIAVEQADGAYVQQEAVVRQAQSAVAQAQARAAKTVVRAPIRGEIVKMDLRVGEFVSSQKIVMRVSSDDGFEVEVFVPELDVADVREGAKVRVTLDAFGDDVEFGAHVYSIETAETFLEGVPTYKTIIHFDEEDERVTSGMTANVEIIVDEREDVVVVPVRAVVKDGDRRFVRRLENGEVVEYDVVTGLKGSEGTIELDMFDGLNVGDEIVLFEK